MPSSVYDEARACGALCHLCPLSSQEAKPVPAELPPGAFIYALGQEPGVSEVRWSRPMCGSSGRVLDEALTRAGLSRDVVATDNVVACAPPGGDLRAYEQRLMAKNRRAEKRGEPTTLLPSQACAPRVRALAAQYTMWVPLGGAALATLAPGLKGGVDGNRGRLHREGATKCLPTYNPARVLRDPRLMGVFVGDLQRAVRFFADRLTWREPQLIFRPTMQQIEEGLFRYAMSFRGQRMHVYDVETDNLSPLTARLRCIGVGTDEWAMIIPYDPVAWRRLREEGYSDAELPTYYELDDTTLPLYSPEERRERDALVARWAADVQVVKAGWNSGSYDRIVMEQRFGVTPTPILDLMLVHRVVEPDLPHDLGFVGSHWTDVHNWKADHRHGVAKNDQHEWRYNGIDIVTPARMAEPLYAAAEQRNTAAILPIDHAMQSVCVGMQRQGMLVDQVERERLEAVTRAKTLRWVTKARGILHAAGLDVSDVVKRNKRKDADALAAAREVELDLQSIEEDPDWQPDAGELGVPDALAFNPLSGAQVRSVLFDLWDLSPPTDLAAKDRFTKSGDASVGDTVLRALLITALEDEQRAFIEAIRMARRHAKLWGTYLRPMRPPTGDKKLDKGCVLWSDGRLHPSWGVGPVTGRLASAGPNAQNMTTLIKQMIVAGEGNALVTADADQIEFRLAAARWQAARFLRAFADGLDPYQIVMAGIFGQDEIMAFDGAPSTFGIKDFEEDTHFEKMRKLGKGVHLASQYGALVPTVKRLVTSAEDKDKGIMHFSNLSLPQVAAMHASWLESVPEYVLGWAREIENATALGYSVEPITGRRRDFPVVRPSDGPEIVNFPIQASAAGWMNLAMLKVVEQIPFGAWGPGTGVINQCHDAITVECPWGAVPFVTKVLREAMSGTHPAFPGVELKAKPKVAGLTLPRPWAPGETPSPYAKRKLVTEINGRKLEYSDGARSRWASS